MLDFLQNKSDCTGCSACQSVCPVDCIEMVQDSEGFLYPAIASPELCVDCRRCEAVCPSVSGIPNDRPPYIPQAFAALIRDADILRQSSSGGAFSALCQAVESSCKQKIFIFGALFDGLCVRHGFIQGAENMAPFRKSKYVQSDMKSTFREVKRFLNKGENVLFSGTPCQVAGLRRFLEKDHPNLFTVDLICHGVGSPAVFAAALLEAERRFHSKVKRYTFRHKNSDMSIDRGYGSLYELEDGRKKVLYNDDYNALFLAQLSLRPCCGDNCRYRREERQSDITLADFKGKEIVFPQLTDGRDYSTLVVNTHHGEKLLPFLCETTALYPCSLDDIRRFNPLFTATTPANPRRDEFFESFLQGQSLHRLCRQFHLRRFSLKRILKILLPVRCILLVKQLRKWRRFQ